MSDSDLKGLIVDWEMATVGDPRADLGYLLSFWIQSADELPWHDYVTDARGFPTRDFEKHYGDIGRNASTRQQRGNRICHCKGVNRSSL